MNPKILFAIAFLLMIFNIARSVWYFWLRRDISLPSFGVRKWVSWAALAAETALGALYAVMFFQKDGTTAGGTAALAGAVLLTLLLVWIFDQLDGMKAHFMDILETLVGLIEVGNPNLDGHSLYVQNLSMLIYDHLPAEQQRAINPENLKYASLFLDLGKLGVSGHILNKSGKLETEEWEMMKRHPEIGVRILSPIGNFEMISDWILYHHERVDGTGYYHLKGEEIPLASRIIAVADTFSALTMARSYKASLSLDDAIEELRLAAGTQLDAEIVRIFCEDIPRASLEACMKDMKKKMERYLEDHFRER